MARKKVEKDEEIEEVVEEVKDEEIKDEEVEEKVEETETKENDEYEALSIEDRMTNVEKKMNVIIALICAVLALSLITMVSVLNGGTANSGSQETQKEEEQQSAGTYDISEFKEIKGSEIASESNGQTIVVMIGRQGCGYCAAYAPVITKVAKEFGVTVRYVNLLSFLDISTNPAKVIDQVSFNAINSLEGEKGVQYTGEDALHGTPATLFIRNNKIVDFISGYTDETTLKAVFTTSGLGR